MLNRWRIALILTVMVSISVFLSGCGSDTNAGNGSNNTTTAQSLGTPGAYSCIQGSITASGSTALAPLVKPIAANYQAKCQGSSITVNLGGSGTGLGQVESGSVDIGDSDIFSKAGQQDVVDHQVAVVIFGVVINSNVTGITSLTSDQLKGIYSGKITNWKEVGGPDLKIVVVSRPTSSGTRSTFQSYILDGPETVSGPSNLITDSTSTVIQNVQQNSGAIGYSATGPAKKAGVTIISIDGHTATADQVKTNSYKFWNAEHMYTKGKPKPLAQALIDYMTSSYGNQRAQAQGFLPIATMTPDALQAHQPKR